MTAARKLILVTSLVLLAGVTIFYLRRPSGNTPPEGSADPALELLTILGDVANRPRDLPGRWRKAKNGAAPGAVSGEESEELSEMMALPYLQGYKEAPARDNITRHDTTRAYEGVNLYTSGHAPEAFLMDMDGTVLHRWRMNIDDVWPEVPHTIHSTFWRRVHAYPNGDLLAIWEGIGIVKLDRFSRLLWAYRGGCHHEAFVTAEGDIYVLARRARIISRINPVRPVLEDVVLILDAQGTRVAEYSLLESMENSAYRHLMRGMRRRGDLFHTNSLYVFDGSMSDLSPHFKKGNVLVSFLKLDTIAIADLQSKQVVWAKSGGLTRMWRRQHDPVLLDNGHFLLFDNLGRGGTSKVIEFDPNGMKTVWEFAGADGDTLYSMTCGTTDRLPNGNTLITESDNGRALEVTPGREVVWEFYNPHRAGENGGLIATLFDLTRFDKGYFAWLESK
ncbi:MAG: arylsulfotransferase family protein [Candidatus Krumholzibacteriia bacterium]